MRLYQVIYADPPWEYSFSKSDSRAIENKYATMTVADLCGLRVPADPAGAVLYLWATAPKLLEGLEVLRAWNFAYRTCAVWDKKKPGMGFWFRGQHELLLVGTMGSISPPKESERVSSVIQCQRGEHSLKPAIVRESIGSWYPWAAKLEMFARESHEGWDTFGYEVAPTLFDQTPRQREIEAAYCRRAARAEA